MAVQRTLADAAELAADGIIDLAQHAENEHVRLRANETILDRVGIRPGVELQVIAADAGQSPHEIIRARLETLRKRTPPIASG